MIRMSMFRALAALVVIATLGACSGEKPRRPGDLGAVGLAIKLSETVTVNTVRYSITGASLAPLEGNIEVSDPGATISALIDVPAGVGYTIELAAVSTDLGTTCLGEAGFDVVAGQTTSLAIVLQCQGEEGAGSVAVEAVFNNCPVASDLVVAPRTVGVGGKLMVSGAASDSDAADTLTYAWTASGGGTFAATNVGSTSFACAVAGTHELTFTVSDGKCVDSRTVSVTCTP
ncbi:MAG: PKD domain-containing protein [Myxococcales bacterium]|nr:PKD domain-containing protein [Myxococcales bacterium]